MYKLINFEVINEEIKWDPWIQLSIYSAYLNTQTPTHAGQAFLLNSKTQAQIINSYRAPLTLDL